MTDKIIEGDDGDKETLCKHGIGHSDELHTCDDCCSKDTESLDEKIDMLVRDITKAGSMPKSELRRRINHLAEEAIQEGYNRGRIRHIQQDPKKQGFAKAFYKANS